VGVDQDPGDVIRDPANGDQDLGDIVQNHVITDQDLMIADLDPGTGTDITGRERALRELIMLNTTLLGEGTLQREDVLL
jgi:hypothetical protein